MRVYIRNLRLGISTDYRFERGASSSTQIYQNILVTNEGRIVIIDTSDIIFEEAEVSRDVARDITLVQQYIFQIDQIIQAKERDQLLFRGSERESVHLTARADARG